MFVEGSLKANRIFFNFKNNKFELLCNSENKKIKYKLILRNFDIK